MRREQIEELSFRSQAGRKSVSSYYTKSMRENSNIFKDVYKGGTCKLD